MIFGLRNYAFFIQLAMKNGPASVSRGFAKGGILEKCRAVFEAEIMRLRGRGVFSVCGVRCGFWAALPPVRAPACPINFFAPGKCIAGTVRHRLRAAPSAHLHLFCRRRRHNKFDSLRARARHSLLPLGSRSLLAPPPPRRPRRLVGVRSLRSPPKKTTLPQV